MGAGVHRGHGGTYRPEPVVDGVETVAVSRDSHRGDVGTTYAGVGQRLTHRVRHRVRHAVHVALHPARAWAVEGDLGAAHPDLAAVEVEQHRLGHRLAGVDAQQQVSHDRSHPP